MNRKPIPTTEEINNLKGYALKDMARGCSIKGRSKMKADDLRTALEAFFEPLRDAEEQRLRTNNAPVTVISVDPAAIDEAVERADRVTTTQRVVGVNYLVQAKSVEEMIREDNHPLYGATDMEY